VDLSAFPGTYEVEWYRPDDGAAKAAGIVPGGAPRELTAPWPGHDAVLRLQRRRG